MITETLQNDVDRGYFFPSSAEELMKVYESNGNRWKFSDLGDRSEGWEERREAKTRDLQDPANPPTADQIYASWNLSSGDQGFDPAADANNDGVVNSLDLEFASGPTEEAGGGGGGGGMPGIAGKVVMASPDPAPNFDPEGDLRNRRPPTLDAPPPSLVPTLPFTVDPRVGMQMPEGGLGGMQMPPKSPNPATMTPEELWRYYHS